MTTRAPLRASIVAWWLAVAPAVKALNEACISGRRASAVAAARAAMVAIGREPVPVGEERTVAEFYATAAVIADVWRQGDNVACRDAWRLLGRCIADLRG